MASPRVFISSTCYDLRQVRADPQKFIKSLGFEPILSERGSVPYGRHERLEDDCYREVNHCDILVSIIGGRYGSPAAHEPYSVSQREVQTAIEQGKQVYIFVEEPVWAEYHTYLHNKDVEGIKFRHVDDRRIYEFLEELTSLRTLNPTFQFSDADSIITLLRTQWAGLFQRFLQEKTAEARVKALEDIQQTSRTLKQLVTFLTRRA